MLHPCKLAPECNVSRSDAVLSLQDGRDLSRDVTTGICDVTVNCHKRSLHGSQKAGQ